MFPLVKKTSHLYLKLLGILVSLDLLRKFEEKQRTFSPDLLNGALSKIYRDRS